MTHVGGWIPKAKQRIVKRRACGLISLLMVEAVVDGLRTREGGLPFTLLVGRGFVFLLFSVKAF